MAATASGPEWMTASRTYPLLNASGMRCHHSFANASRDRDGEGGNAG
jgi:hypothetical protein